MRSILWDNIMRLYVFVHVCEWIEVYGGRSAPLPALRSHRADTLSCGLPRPSRHLAYSLACCSEQSSTQENS